MTCGNLAQAAVACGAGNKDHLLVKLPYYPVTYLGTHSTYNYFTVDISLDDPFEHLDYLHKPAEEIVRSCESTCIICTTFCIVTGGDERQGVRFWRSRRLL